MKNIFNKIPTSQNPDNLDTAFIENEVMESSAYYDYFPFDELLVKMAYGNFPTFYINDDGYIDWKW